MALSFTTIKPEDHSEMPQQDTITIDFLKSLPDSGFINLLTKKDLIGSYQQPFLGKVISPYGKRGKIMHTGTDIKLQKGDTVKAAFTGVVTKASNYYGYGKLIVVKHNFGIETYYAHLSKFLIKVNDTVTTGQPIGLGGRTGRATTNHLHFEIRCDKIPRNPLIK